MTTVDRIEPDKKFVARMIIARTFVLAIIILVVFFFDIFGSRSINLSSDLACLFFIVALVQLVALVLWYRNVPFSKLFFLTQVGFDIFVVTGIIYITGSSLSPLSFLYLPLVMMVASYASIYATMLTAVVGGIVYFMLSWLTFNGIVRPFESSQVIVEPFGGVWLQSVGLISGMVLVGYLTNFLKQAIQNSKAIVEKSMAELRSLDELHRGVFDGLPQATIIVNSNLVIQRLNLAACETFKIGANVIGKPIIEIFDSKIPNLKTIIDLAGSNKDFQIEFNPGDRPSYFRLNLQRLNPDSDSSDICMTFFDETDLCTAEERLAAHDQMVRHLNRQDSEAMESFYRDGFELVGCSDALCNVFGLVQRVAPSDTTVMVTGESGTGKELVARAIHNRSMRSNGRFVPVNCGAIPENLMESQFFGHLKGSFTGADRNHEGFFQQAHGGTLFLDEVAELPLAMQVKLLRVLQEKQVRPVGSEHEIKVDVRIISATHRDLNVYIATGRFREDLYYRLNVVNIGLPPLRDRKEDIPLLLEYHLRNFKGGAELPMIHPETLACLKDYNYPGNVRELQNIVERAIVLGGNAILPEHLPGSVRYGLEKSAKHETDVIELPSVILPCKLDNVLEELEKLYIERALEKGFGSRKEAARLLGINARSLRYRLQKFGFDD
jgi:two-component system response regulator PilR (NtrC family)